MVQESTMTGGAGVCREGALELADDGASTTIYESTAPTKPESDGRSYNNENKEDDNGSVNKAADAADREEDQVLWGPDRNAHQEAAREIFMEGRATPDVGFNIFGHSFTYEAAETEDDRNDVDDLVSSARDLLGSLRAGGTSTKEAVDLLGNLYAGGDGSVGNRENGGSGEGREEAANADANARASSAGHRNVAEAILENIDRAVLGATEFEFDPEKLINAANSAANEYLEPFVEPFFGEEAAKEWKAMHPDVVAAREEAEKNAAEEAAAKEAAEAAAKEQAAKEAAEREAAEQAAKEEAAEEAAKEDVEIEFVEDVEEDQPIEDKGAEMPEEKAQEDNVESSKRGLRGRSSFSKKLSSPRIRSSSRKRSKSGKRSVKFLLGKLVGKRSGDVSS